MTGRSRIDPASLYRARQSLRVANAEREALTWRNTQR